MKKVIKITMVPLAMMILSGSIVGQQQKPKYTAEEIYQFFEQYSPNDVVDYAQAAVDFFGEKTKNAGEMTKEKEEALFKQLLTGFHKLPLKFQWEKFPFLSFIVPQRCDELRVIAHPIPEFFDVMSQMGFLKQYKDVKGKKFALKLCQKLSSNPQGVWGWQYQWWPLTDKPLEMGVLLLQIPNSPYQIQSFYPTRKYNQDQLNNLLSKYQR